MIKIIKDSKIIEAIRLQEQIVNVNYILRNKLIAKDKKYICKADTLLSREELMEFGITDRFSDISFLLAKSKEFYKND